MIQIPFFIVNHTATMMLTIKRKSVNLFFAQQDVFNRSLTGPAVQDRTLPAITIKQKRKERRNKNLNNSLAVCRKVLPAQRQTYSMNRIRRRYYEKESIRSLPYGSYYGGRDRLRCGKARRAK
jgi:hypothetical protein